MERSEDKLRLTQQQLTPAKQLLVVPAEPTAAARHKTSQRGRAVLYSSSWWLLAANTLSSDSGTSNVPPAQRQQYLEPWVPLVSSIW
jgi:hypothetical protein